MSGDAINQLHSYLRVTSAFYGIAVDDTSTRFFKKASGNQIFEIDDILLSQSSYDVRNNESATKVDSIFGIIKLKKVNYLKRSSHYWVFVEDDIKFQIQTKDLQNYSKIQSASIEAGSSLLNYNPSKVQWKKALHLLFQEAECIEEIPPTDKGRSIDIVLVDFLGVVSQSNFQIKKSLLNTIKMT